MGADGDERTRSNHSVESRDHSGRATCSIPTRMASSVCLGLS